MAVITAIADLHGPWMLQAVATHGLVFELGRVVLTGLIVAAWTMDRSGPRIWK